MCQATLSRTLVGFYWTVAYTIGLTTLLWEQEVWYSLIQQSWDYSVVDLDSVQIHSVPILDNWGLLPGKVTLEYLRVQRLLMLSIDYTTPECYVNLCDTVRSLFVTREVVGTGQPVTLRRAAWE